MILKISKQRNHWHCNESHTPFTSNQTEHSHALSYHLFRVIPSVSYCLFEYYSFRGPFHNYFTVHRKTNFLVNVLGQYIF